MASFMSTIFTPLGLVATPVAITGAILSSILLKIKIRINNYRKAYEKNY